MGYVRATAQPKRAHPITVFGCTGNAGKAVAYHVIRNAAQQILSTNDDASLVKGKIALAGRNKARLTKVLLSIQNELSAEGIINSSFIINNVNIIIADVTNYTSMLEVCQSTNVLISATGPYSRYGEPVVRACIECKTHYVDITGEVPWVERMIGKRQCVCVCVRYIVFMHANIMNIKVHFPTLYIVNKFLRSVRPIGDRCRGNSVALFGV